MISPIHAQPNWRLDEPAAPAFFRSVSGIDSETEITEDLAHAAADIVTDNKDTAGSYLMEPEGIGWASHTRPFNDGLILYNGHAGLGETTAVRVPGKPEIPKLTDCPLYGIGTTATITTATPGVGDIARTVDLRSDP